MRTHNWFGFDYGYVYVFQCGPLFKIGRSVNPRRRIQQLRTATPFPLITIYKLRTVFYREIEKELHSRFRGKRQNGEWFALEPADIDYIKALDEKGRARQ